MNFTGCGIWSILKQIQYDITWLTWIESVDVRRCGSGLLPGTGLQCLTTTTKKFSKYYLTDWLTPRSWVATSLSVAQEFFNISWNPKGLYYAHRNPPLHERVSVLHIWVRILKRVHSSPVPITGPEETSFMLTETSNILSYLVNYPNYITPGAQPFLRSR
jgi:hypothetical protein